MAGHWFMVSGDPGMARDTIYMLLTQQGFKVTRTGDWTGHAERGSAGASIALGALAGSQGRHVIVDTSASADPSGNWVFRVTEGTSGWSGGIIGRGQASSIYDGIYKAIGATFQQAGVLVSTAQLPS